MRRWQVWFVGGLVLLWGLWAQAQPQFELQVSQRSEVELAPIERIEVSANAAGEVTIAIKAASVAWTHEQRRHGNYILDLPHGLITNETIIVAVNVPLEWGNANRVTGRLVISPEPTTVSVQLSHQWQTNLNPAPDNTNYQLPPEEALLPVLDAPPRSAFLTFDDGPWPETTLPLLETLETLGVPATFFVIGAHVDQYPDLAAAIHAHHFAIANHTYTHDYSRLYSSDSLFFEEIEHTQTLMDEADYQPLAIIRPPGGFPLSENLHLSLQQAGYSVLYWNISPDDAYADQTAAAIIERIDSQIQQYADSDLPLVVLLHDRWPHTVEALPAIIEHIQAAGYRFLPLS